MNTFFKLYILVLEILIRSFSFGAGAGVYQNSFANISYDVYKYNNNIDGRYINRASNSPTNSQADFFLNICSCYEKVFVNYYLHRSGIWQARSFQSYSYTGEYLAFREKDVLGLDEGGGSRGYGGIRAGYRIFESSNYKPAIILGHTIFGGGYNYYPLYIKDNQFNITSRGDFNTSARGFSIGGQLEYIYNSDFLYIFQLHYMDLKGSAAINNHAISLSINRLDNFFMDSQKGRITYRGIEAQIGLRFRLSEEQFTNIGLVFSNLRTTFQMDENWKVTGDGRSSNFGIDRFLATQLQKPKFNTDDIYFGFRLSYELNLSALNDKKKP